MNKREFCEHFQGLLDNLDYAHLRVHLQDALDKYKGKDSLPSENPEVNLDEIFSKELL